MRWISAILLAASALLLGSCGKTESGDEVAAIVDGHKIYRTEVDEYYQN